MQTEYKAELHQDPRLLENWLNEHGKEGYTIDQLDFQAVGSSQGLIRLTLVVMKRKSWISGATQQ